MAHSLSAKKRVRQNAKRRAINTWRKKRVKTQVKAFLKAVADQNLTAAQEEFRKTCGVLDKMATTSTLHRNAAARSKSRLHRRLKALQTASA
jgi:small subunit ribosomal protein S20